MLSTRLASKGAGKNYLYRFDVDLNQNFVKKAHVTEDEWKTGKYPGASHCDELPYIFKTGPDTNIDSPAIESKEFEMIKTMVDTFTSFAESGDPNNSRLKKWETVNEASLQGMNINENGSKMMEFPENSRIKVWNEIFKKENVALY